MQKVRFSNIQGLCDQAPPLPKTSNDSTQVLTLICKRKKAQSGGKLLMVGEGHYEGKFLMVYIYIDIFIKQSNHN